MLTINGENWELPQIGKEPTMGYSDEYIEKTMISGKIRRIYKGRRFYAQFYYGYLTAEQRLNLENLLATQREQGYLAVNISNQYGSFSGEAIIDLNENQRSFDPKNDTWLDWQISLKAVDYDD